MYAKKKYEESLRGFNRCKDENSRKKLIRMQKGVYRNVEEEEKEILIIKKIESIEKLRQSRPKDFWRYFKQRKNKIIRLSL